MAQAKLSLAPQSAPVSELLKIIEGEEGVEHIGTRQGNIRE